MQPSGPPGPSGETQLQRTRADIKNILPIDLYECMGVVSLITSSTITGSKKILPRHTTRFYQLFFALFQYTAPLISDGLQREIKTWFARMPGRHWDTPLILAGVTLYIRFYQELADYGIVTLFEGVIQPDFDDGLDDLDLIGATAPPPGLSGEEEAPDG